MKLDDLLSAESPQDQGGPLDDILVNALAALGFTHVGYSLTKVWVIYAGIITGTRADGSTMRWQGAGKTPEEAEMNAVDDLAKWIHTQQIGTTP